MKKYKFKLDALLKIRKLKEETCKMEIGRLQVQITNKQKEIAKHNSGIKEAFEGQEAGLSQGMTGQEIQFHPFFVKGKRAHIKQLENEIAELEDYKEKKYNELKYLRADVKVIEEMKTKDREKYKKQLQKKMDEQIEEQVQNWRQYLG